MAGKVHQYRKIISETILILILFLCSNVVSYAQEILSLKEAVDSALYYNHEIKIDSYKVMQADNNFSAGNAGMLPSVSLTGQYEKSAGYLTLNAYTGHNIDDNNAVSDFAGLRASLNWKVFDGFKMFNKYNRLEKEVSLSSFEKEAEIEKTILSVIKAYAFSVYQKNVLKVQMEKLKISEYRTDIARKMFENGSFPEIEHLRSLVDLKADSFALIKQQAELENAITVLNKEIGRDFELNFDIADSLSLSDLPDLESLMILLEKQNSELAYSGCKIEVKELMSDEIAGDFFPEVSLNASYLYSETDAEPAFIHYNRFLGARFGVYLKYDLFVGFNRARRAENARLEEKIAKENNSKKKLELISLLKETYNSYSYNMDLIELEKENIELAEKNLEIIQNGYTEGLYSALDYRQAQLDVFNSALRLSNAVYKAKIYETMLKFLSGTIRTH